MTDGLLGGKLFLIHSTQRFLCTALPTLQIATYVNLTHIYKIIFKGFLQAFFQANLLHQGKDKRKIKHVCNGMFKE